MTGAALVSGGRPLAHAFRATSFAVSGSARASAIGDPVDASSHHPQSGIPDSRQPDVPSAGGMMQFGQPPFPQPHGGHLFSTLNSVSGSLLSCSQPGLQKATSVSCGHRISPDSSGISLTGNHNSVRSFSSNSGTNGDHRDIRIPDFSAYRRPSTSDPTRRSERDSGRAFTYLISGSLVASSVTFGKWFGGTLVASWSASKDVLALAKIEVNLSEIPAGKNVVLKWRGKPLFIKHRTQEEIERERAVDVTSLRDPQRDEERVRGDPRWLVLLGVCTHLGCVPIAGQGEYGGYYCPCHGSHYDGSGRIRKGPAPLNLEVPEYAFEGENTLVVG